MFLSNLYSPYFITFAIFFAQLILGGYAKCARVQQQKHRRKAKRNTFAAC